MRILVIAVAVVGMLVATAAAQSANDKAAAQAAYAEGQQRYDAGDYLPAAAKFEAAYGLDPDPVYLFNIAQAYRLGNACAKAVTYYQRFLDAFPNPPNLDKVKQYQEQANACVANTATLTPGVVPHGPAITEPVTRTEPADPGRMKRTLGLAGIFVGGASLGLGVFFTTRVGKINDDRAAAATGCTITMPCAADYADDYNRRGHRAEILQGVFYGVGGALVVGGVVLYVMGRKTETSSVAVVPTAGGAYATAAFSF